MFQFPRRDATVTQVEHGGSAAGGGTDAIVQQVEGQIGTRQLERADRTS